MKMAASTPARHALRKMEDLIGSVDIGEEAGSPCDGGVNAAVPVQAAQAKEQAEQAEPRRRRERRGNVRVTGSEWIRLM